MMLLGITSHVMGFVQNLVDKYSTTEADDTFTPRRNMYLYGIGYAAASIDCTAAAVLPFVIFLTTLGTTAIGFGIAGLMVGLLVLMIAVTMLVGMGRQVMINFLRRATGHIKMIGSWMMIMAGVGLTIYLTNAEAVNALRTGFSAVCVGRASHRQGGGRLRSTCSWFVQAQHAGQDIENDGDDHQPHDVDDRIDGCEIVLPIGGLR